MVAEQVLPPDVDQDLELLLAVSVQAAAHVERVVQRDLVVVRHDLVERRVLEGGGHVAQERRHGLAGVEDVAVGAEDDDEAVERLQHEVAELLVAQELRLPVRLDLLGLGPDGHGVVLLQEADGRLEHGGLVHLPLAVGADDDGAQLDNQAVELVPPLLLRVVPGLPLGVVALLLHAVHRHAHAVSSALYPHLHNCTSISLENLPLLIYN